MTNGRKKRLRSVLAFWFVLYPAAMLVGLLHVALRITGRVRVVHAERFPWSHRIVLAANHPSLWEPVVLPGLFFPWYVIKPRQRMPWPVVDKSNYMDKWYWFPFQMRFIAVPRDNKVKLVAALRRLQHVVQMGHTVILFPEGGRTGKDPNPQYTSTTRKKLRRLKHGVADLVITCGATVVPVWVDGADRVLPNGKEWLPRVWRPMTLVIGHPISFPPDMQDRDVVLDTLAKALLELADEV